MVNVGDQVLLVTGGHSVFKVIEIDGDQAIVESVDTDAPGRYPFPARVASLVPVDTE
ncbi:hypothetical protein [Nocardia otitidiscaviarum]|uniref:hypothetical protein n=1 Tax=Nocardia otitidiscaviarum TaxID=1823 RepID=UPI0024575A2C|nr:hypothetical protein [Nocardia otitidiscaviarum]